jgi:branched-chain amino acid aminotransferase
MPAMAKAGGNYLLGQLMKLEAIEEGFQEAIALDVFGNLSEGTGENLFAVKDDVIYTPHFASSLLPGVTRASVIQLAEEAGYKVVVDNIPREMVYIADELFFTGTAAEVTPIRSVDGLKVKDGKPGPITMDLQGRFFNIVKKAVDPHGWLKIVFND